MGCIQLGLNFGTGRSGIRTQGQMVMSHPLAYRRAQRPKGIGVRRIAVGYCFTVAWPTEHHQPCIQHSRTKSVSYMAHEAPSPIKLVRRDLRKPSRRESLWVITSSSANFSLATALSNHCRSVHWTLRRCSVTTCRALTRQHGNGALVATDCVAFVQTMTLTAVMDTVSVPYCISPVISLAAANLQLVRSFLVAYSGLATSSRTIRMLISVHSASFIFCTAVEPIGSRKGRVHSQSFHENCCSYYSRSGVIRTRDLAAPNGALYQAELHSEDPHWFTAQTKNGIYRHPRRDFVFTSGILRSFLPGQPYWLR